MNLENGLITNILKAVIVLLLLSWCFLIVQPFVLIILWAVILAVAVFPAYTFILRKFSSSHKKLITIVFGLIISVLILIPTYVVTKTIATDTMNTVNAIKDNSFRIPEPSATVKEWPLIGDELYKQWSEAATDIKNYAIIHKEDILEQVPNLLSGFKGFIGAFVTFLFAFIIAFVFMYYSEYLYTSGTKFSKKLIGETGEEVMLTSRDIIRSVVKGILLVAIIQSGLAFIGFSAIGLPASGVFAFAVLVLAILQIPAILVMIPAIIIAFSISDTTPAVIFTIYCILVGFVDNVLKPLFLGKGNTTPIVIILIGTTGGMLLHGIIGLFLGAVVLAVMYNLYKYWVNYSNEDAKV